MTSTKKVANAVGGKIARACDSCISKRARWYCAADDAFLCQGCDSSVHSANPLARRHERVRLKVASSRSSSSKSSGSAERELINSALSWHKGFTKKARTPRHGKTTTSSKAKNPFHLVPEEGYSDTNSHEESTGEQLLYRVPIFEPFVADLCTTPSSVMSPAEVETKGCNGTDGRVSAAVVHGFLPSDIELSEFAADVESLLGTGLENECMRMEDLGLLDSTNKEEDCSWECLVGDGKKVKVEVVGDALGEEERLENIERESFELRFDYDDGDDIVDIVDESPAVDEKVSQDVNEDVKSGGDVREDSQGKRKILLQLDYQVVINSWASQKSPWTTGVKPDFNPDHSWPYCMGSCGTFESHQRYCEFGGSFGGPAEIAGRGREARVSRYREKRRTRLFSKKIRYEVRKLNAEKRPRMKGRFVKRDSFTTPSTCPLVKSNGKSK